MKKKIIIGSLGTIIISLLILSSATAVEITRTEKITDLEDKENSDEEIYIDPNIHIGRIHLPILKRSLNIIKNSEFAEYEDFLYQVINLIEMKGSVNSNDIEEIIINSDQEPSGLHFSSMIVATINRVAGVFPLF